MAQHTATVQWNRGTADFVDQRYSRRHTVEFDGGTEVGMSSSPHVVPTPMSDPACVDPEELFVAALASCHLLWFLGIAAAKGFRVDRYRDEAEGTLARDSSGKQAITVVTLRPHVTWSGATQPTTAEVDAMHHEAHSRCFIANSVTTDVRCEPVG